MIYHFSWNFIHLGCDMLCWRWSTWKFVCTFNMPDNVKYMCVGGRRHRVWQGPLEGGGDVGINITNTTSMSNRVFLKRHFEKNKNPNRVRYWAWPRENISRRRGWPDKSRGSPKALEVWKKLTLNRRRRNIPILNVLSFNCILCLRAVSF